MRLTIAYSKIKKRNLVLINNDTYQRETLSERPIRQPLNNITAPWKYCTKTKAVWSYIVQNAVEYCPIFLRNKLGLLTHLNASTFEWKNESHSPNEHIHPYTRTPPSTYTHQNSDIHTEYVFCFYGNMKEISKK